MYLEFWRKVEHPCFATYSRSTMLPILEITKIPEFYDSCQLESALSYILLYKIIIRSNSSFHSSYSIEAWSSIHAVLPKFVTWLIDPIFHLCSSHCNDFRFCGWNKSTSHEVKFCLSDVMPMCKIHHNLENRKWILNGNIRQNMKCKFSIDNSFTDLTEIEYLWSSRNPVVLQNWLHYYPI